jgi:hypothetical protein
MSLLRNLSEGLRSLFGKQRVDTELDEEPSGFLQMAAQEKPFCLILVCSSFTESSTQTIALSAPFLYSGTRSLRRSWAWTFLSFFSRLSLGSSRG